VQGNARIIQQAYAATGKGGRVIVVGLPGATEQARLNAMFMVAGERSIRGSIYGGCNPTQDFKTFVEWQKSGDIDLEPLVTKVRPLVEINEALREAAEGKEVRVVVSFPKPSSL
jgi:Zn-dependent alcohol dehydrogenase